MSSIFKMKSLLFPFPPHLSPFLKYRCISPFVPPTLFSSSPSLPHFKPFSLHKPSSDRPTNPIIEPHQGLSPDSQMETLPLSGQIHVIVGPMFAGKTTTLLRRVQAERDIGRSVAIIKSNKDTRYELNSVVTHDGAKMSCWSLPDLSTFRTKLGADAYSKLDVIGIDEAQFFEDLYDFCWKAADHDRKTVIVAGLDGDYLRRSFGSVLDIIPLADSVTKLTARCELCGKPALFTLRKTEETQTELIGGADVYMPVCRQHYVDGQVVIEAARNVLESQKIQCDTYLETVPVSSQCDLCNS